MASILDHPQISGRYLFPQSRTLRSPFVAKVNQVELACYHRIVNSRGFTLIHFHGNGEAVSDYVPFMADLFNDMGLNQLFIEYRGYGGSTGEAKLVGMLPDGEAVMKAMGIAPERAIVLGRSIGSLYAIELAYRQPDIAALVIDSGIADPAERFLNYANLEASGLSQTDVRAQIAEHFDHALKLACYSNPLLILHAENDGLIDVSHAERNYQWAGSKQKRLVRFAHGDHNTIFHTNMSRYVGAIQELVDGLGG